MAQTLVQINDNNLRYMVDLRFEDLADRYITNKKYYIGDKISTFDMMATIAMQELLCLTEYTRCEECNISAQLNKYKGNELRL